MIEVIKRYNGKLGEVVVEKFDENGKAEFHVKHSNSDLGATYWSRSKRDAIAYAQFLAGRY